MIQDIEPHVYHNGYEASEPRPSDKVLVFRQRQILSAIDQDGNITLPDAGSFMDKNLQYLFRIDDQRYYLLIPESYEKPVADKNAENAAPDEVSVPGDGPVTDEASAPDPEDGFEYVSLMDIRKSPDLKTMFACMTAFHLNTWYDKNRFCGRCGAALKHSESMRMLQCPVCGNMVFPTIAPAVIVGVTDGDRLLMTKYAGRAYKGWALIAGFCEIGEAVEDTVHREVMEEAGVRVKNLRYAASQPWGIDSNLLIGMFCELDGDDSIHMDREELSKAVWVERADVPEMENNPSLTGYMIELFRTGREYDIN